MNKLIRVAFLFVLSISVFSIGVFCGTKLNKDNQERVIEEINKSSDIALINLDEGVEIEGKKLYYAQNLLSTQGENLKFTSLNDAKIGLENGTYAAYILIPSTFSASIESINEKPVKVELEYELSDKLAPESKAGIVKDIEDFKLKLSNDISYMYVSAVMDEFHNAQDNSKLVLDNDKKELESMSLIKVRDVISHIDFPEIEFVEFVRNRLEIEPIVSSNLELIDAMKNSLLEKIQLGKDDYESVSKDKGLLDEGSKDFLNILGGLDIESDDNGEPVYQSGIDKLATQVNNYNAQLIDNRAWIVSELASNSNATRSSSQEYVDNSLSNIKNSWQNNIDTALREANQNIERLVTQALENLLAIQERIYDELDLYVRDEFQAAHEYYKQEAKREVESYKENLINELIEEGYIDDDETDPIYAIIASSSNADIRIATYSNAESFSLRNAQVDFIDRNNFNSPMLSASADFQDTDLERRDSLFDIPDISYLLGEANIVLPENQGAWYAGFIEGLERMYTISTVDIEKTVKDEVVGAIKSKTSAKYEDLKDVISKLNKSFDDYQNSLYQFDPFARIDVRILEQSAKSINSNVRDIAGKSAEYASEQSEEVAKVREKESERTKALRENMDTANKSTEDLVGKTLDGLKDARQSNTDTNKTLLEDFNNKLSYTKVGSIANKEVFEFISAPVQSSEIKNVRQYNFKNFIKTESPYEKVNIYVMIVSAVMTLGMGIGMGFIRFRKGKNA
jgi:hypothetical protein